MSRRILTDRERAEYRQAKRAEQREQVERATRALLCSDGWRAWAETRATFHEYSMGNCILIATQRPDATQVAGFKAWQQLGRQVRKGEHGIRIMAPMVVKQRCRDCCHDCLRLARSRHKRRVNPVSRRMGRVWRPGRDPQDAKVVDRIAASIEQACGLKGGQR